MLYLKRIHDSIHQFKNNDEKTVSIYITIIITQIV